MLANHPEENIQNSEYGESLKSRIIPENVGQHFHS
jgi:hypothetical protein